MTVESAAVPTDHQHSAPIRTRGAKARIAREKALDPSFAEYLRSIAPYPLLTRAEEKELGRNRLTGDVSARNKLIEGNLQLVVSIAGCYADQGVPLVDIVGAGNIGLIRAVDKYQPGRARFGTHATWWIREACGRYTMEKASLIRLPRNVMADRHKIHKLEREAILDGEELSDEAIVARSTITPRQVKRARGAADHFVSLDMEIGDGEGSTLADQIPDEHTPGIEEHAINEDIVAELHYKLATELSSRERDVLKLRYGLGSDDDQGLSHREVGIALDINRETVRQIEMAALAKLKESYEQSGNPDKLRQALLFSAV